MFPRKINIKVPILVVSLLVLLFNSNTVNSQEDNSAVSSEDVNTAVYTDVWLPFMESYRTLDTEKFKSLQAEDLIKVSIDRNTIQPKAVYFAEIDGFFNQFKQLKRQMDIKFSILSSADGEGKVYQTGYYSIGSRVNESDSFQPMGYGYFTVVLIKENGLWKISLDADKQVKIDETEFRKAKMIYELE